MVSMRLCEMLVFLWVGVLTLNPYHLLQGRELADSCLACHSKSHHEQATYWCELTATLATV